MLYSEQLGLPITDNRRWRLYCDTYGAERWDYIPEEDIERIPQTNFVKWLLRTGDFPYPNPKVNSSDPGFRASDATYNGAKFFSMIQDEESGIFPCQYQGPMFMTIGYVTFCYITGIEIPEHNKVEMIRYIVNLSHPVDGGWGLHTEGASTMFGTVVNYVILRLLGLPKDHIVCKKARRVLIHHRGAISSPHWAKIWLSLLNLYDWSGVNPAPPDQWLLPYFLTTHPARWWVHTRSIYLPVSYLAGIRYSCKLTPILEEIRSEIYVEPYDQIDFTKHRNTTCGVDLHYPHSMALDILNCCIVFYEKYLRPTWLLKRGNKRVYELIEKDVQNSDNLTVGPVSFAFSAIVAFIEKGRDSPEVERFADKFKEILFHGPLGLTVMGTNGAQVWDCSLFIQYMFMVDLAELPEFRDSIVKAYKFLCRSQFTEECVEGSFRDKRVGGWPFSTKTQGFTVSDCTAEALKAVIMVKKSPAFADVHDEISTKNLENAIDVLLSLQNLGSFEYGSFASYEKIRATLLMEKLNPAEIFCNIMVEYPYVECTDSSVLGLQYFLDNYDYRKEEISHSIKIAVDYIKRSQQKDGSWYGSWGICYTYAGMFALEALYTVHENYENSEVVRKGCDFLVKRQMPDGGWGESMRSCELHTYVNSNKKSQIIQTAWTVIGLLLADYPDKAVIDRGIQILKSRQTVHGEWKYESIEGVFNHSCAIEYPSYRFLFPMKALGLYAKKYGENAI
ncbi:HCL413Wp [Eremothecium sinecaudum]|uniref:Terpene cyclase/mutase family member n=1 Tax=Eremothecium sinecaudum TaxID=45286 RepID=A0A109UY79_9SACH|nr:HCL413Wp [Eremothecium sinecaudum]AMD19738.1 HCL413Wp [Eremothecium sinecaudum]